MKTEQTWELIHTERAALAATLRTLSAEQWSAPSWCTGWSVQQTAGHILAAAEQTPLNFYKELAQAGFRFDSFTDRGAKRLGALAPEEIVSRLEARTTTTNHPPAPTMAMLGEIVVHGEDIRRPLGIDQPVEATALLAVAESFRRSNLLIGSKRRIEGLRLVASDLDWSTGEGPAVSGPMSSLVLVMTGRGQAAGDLEGDGLSTLMARC
jgi:uncharacterized protein (TIGR03083 family)